MVIRLGVGVGAVALLLVVLFAGGGLFGSGSESVPSVTRPGSIPTATAPANLPEAVVLGEIRSTAPAGAGGPNTYVVKSGDTLYGIAGQLGVPAAQQAAWLAEVLRLNNLGEAALLRAGVELRLPTLPTATGTPRATNTPPPSTTRTPTPGAVAPTATPVAGGPTPRPTVAGGGGTYTVVSGDNPQLIGQKLCVPAGELATWAEQLLALNNKTATGLQVGEVLQLPANTLGCGSPTATRTP